jgi:hypothetical protein
MTKSEFIKIRKDAGKMAEEHAATCSKCGEKVAAVATRKEPETFWLVFDAGEPGELHSGCFGDPVIDAD